MAENLVINGVTYPETEVITAQNEEGNPVAFYPDAVRYKEQALTEEQQAQARENIGAASQEAVKGLSEEIDDYLPKNQGSANVGKILVVGTDGNLILAEMPEGASGDVTGIVDESNNILLMGHLADGVYALKYENADGTYTEIGTLEVGAIVTYTITQNLTNVTSDYSAMSVREGESLTINLTANSGCNMSTVTVTMGGTDITSTAYSGGVVTIASVTGKIIITAVATKPNYTNQIPISTDTDGSIYNGKGFKEETRISASSGTISANTAVDLTGFIPCTSGDIVRMKDIAFVWATMGGTGGLHFYAANKTTKIVSANISENGTLENLNNTYKCEYDDNGNVIAFTVLHRSSSETPIAYVRICASDITTESIVTVNEEIT